MNLELQMLRTTNSFGRINFFKGERLNLVKEIERKKRMMESDDKYLSRLVDNSKKYVDSSLHHSKISLMDSEKMKQLQ